MDTPKLWAILLLAPLFALQAFAAEPLFLQPLEVMPGDQYRLAFVTSTLTEATSSDIQSYNAFVQRAADESPIVGAWGLTWSAIVSTETVDARDNTGTNHTIEEGVPIYLIDGTTLLAPNNATFWGDQPWGSDFPFNLTELGERTEDDFELIDAWTGTLFDGTRFDKGPRPGWLGSFTPTGGDPSDLFGGWIVGNSDRRLATDRLPLYAISETLIAVPEPDWSSAIVFASAFATLRTWKRDRRSK